MKTRTFLYLSLFTFYFLLFPSCLTISRIQRNCDKFAQICVTEKETVTVYRDTTIFRTDTIRVPLPYRDTVKIIDTVQIINNLAWLPPVHKKIGIIGVNASVARSILNINAYLTDSTVLHTRRDTITLEKVIKEKAETKTVPVRFIPDFYKFTFWFFFLQVTVLIIVGIYIVRKTIK